MGERIRLVQVGLGPVGKMLTPVLLARQGLEIVAGVDVDPTKVGKDLGDVCEVGRKLNVPVHDSLTKVPTGSADMVVLTTTSRLENIFPSLEEAAEKRLRVVSTCEEMVFPWVRQPEWADKIDRLAKVSNVAFLATGVNPGFLMDLLPLVASGICESVQSVRVERIQDASQRRVPFQRKIGAGLRADEFQAKAARGEMGHVGLTESMQMIAAAFGWRLEHIEDKFEAVLADHQMKGADGFIEPGRAIGIRQKGKASVGKRTVIELEFRASLGEKENHEQITIQGNPSFSLSIPGGINGDVATCAIVTNMIPRLLRAAPGLRTMLDLPPPAWWSENDPGVGGAR